MEAVISYIDTGHTAFVLISMALVNLMTPGLAFFYGGLVRQTTVLTIMTQNYACMGLVTIIWMAWGFSLCFGESATVFGSPKSFLFFDRVTGVPLPTGDGTEPFVEGIPGLVFAGYQGMFAVITPALMTGAFADRLRFLPFLVLVTIWMHVVYFPFCHWVWGPEGWLGTWGVVDFAGGIVVHITAGFSALALVVALPSREKVEGAPVDVDPHNVPFVALGTGLLWFGWFGFNAGSALGATPVAAYAAVNSEISASAALMVWIFIEWKLEGQPTLVGACVGAIAGLATITPAAGFVKPWAALIIGCCSSPFCYFCIKLANRLGLDDALDVWGVHGMGGYLGTLTIGVFADPEVNGVAASPEQFAKQFAAASGAALYSFLVAFVLVKIIGRFSRLMPNPEEIEEGLDRSFHKNAAYKGDYEMASPKMTSMSSPKFPDAPSPKQFSLPDLTSSEVETELQRREKEVDKKEGDKDLVSSV